MNYNGGEILGKTTGEGNPNLRYSRDGPPAWRGWGTKGAGDANALAIAAARQPAMKRLARFVLPALLLAAASMGFLYLRATRPEATPAPAEERALPVAVVEARYVDVRPPIFKFGAVVAGSVVELLRRVARDVLVRADIAPGARIVTTHFPEIGPGQRVEAR